MSEHRDIPEPGELVYPPRPSWAPAFFAFGAAGAVCGIFAEGFMFRGWIYSIVAVIVLLFALRAMIKLRDAGLLPLTAQAARPRRRAPSRNDLPPQTD